MTVARCISVARAFGRKASVILVAALLLASCTSAQNRGRDVSLPEILSDARAHPENRVESTTACEHAIDGRSIVFPYMSFFSGLFDVSEENGGQAFCAALIEAVVTGELTEQNLRAFQRPSAVRGKAPLGTLLRKVLEAHERLKAQQA